MAKILILANNDIGLYKFRKELIEELLLDHEVYISLPRGEFVKKLVDLGCKFIETKIDRRGTNPIVDFKLILEYKKIIDESRPDVVLSYTIKPNIYGGIVCRLTKTPYIPNITGLGTAVENSGILQSVTLALYKFAFKYASCVFFQNEENAEFIKSKGVIRGKSKIIPGSGVNLEYYKPLNYPDEDNINFLFISRVMKEKGIEQYLNAAEYIKKKYVHTNFHILGFCEESYENILNKYEKAGIVKYHGMQNDIIKFQEMSHCTVHPTYYPEGMSNVLLESAACARPIITTDRSGCREIVEDGVNGFLIEEKNTSELICQIEKFINLSKNEKKEMGIQGRKKIEKEFDREIVVNAYLKEINKEIPKKS